MRLKFAAALVILGLLAMGWGVGQRTLWAPPETVTSTLSADAQQAPVTILEHTLNDASGHVEVSVEGEGDLVLAVGRAADVEAWVGDAAHLTVSGVDGEQLQSRYTEGEGQVPDPRGSDLWQSQETAEGELIHQWIDPAPGDWSILLATDGTEPAPTEISLTRANTEGTPWAIPLIVIGAVLTVLGLALLFGPKRTKPAPASGSDAGPAAGTRAYQRQSEARSRRRGRSKSGIRRSVRASAGAMGAAVASLSLVVGHGASAQASETPTPPESSEAATAPPSAEPATAPPSSPTSSGAAEQPDGYPVVLPTQLERIVDSVADTVGAADAAQSAEQLTPRVAGPALELRSSNYEIRSHNADHQAPVPIAAEPMLAEVVTSTVEWPRTVVVVTQSEENEVPQALLLVQDGPRENYKLRSAVQMLPGTSFPQVADNADGTRTLPMDGDAGLVQSPASALAAVADILSREDSELSDQVAENTFIEQISAFQNQQIEANENADITFSHTVVEENTRALRTGNGGALVFGYLSNSMTSSPEEEGGTVELDEDYAALAGEDSTEAGISITFGESVMLYVPPADSSEQVQVIGAAQDLVDAQLMDD